MPTDPTPPRRARHIAAVALATATMFALGSMPADAGRQTHSPTIADAADRAVSALERWQGTRNPADYVRYVRGRDSTAGLASAELDIDADDLRQAWADAPVAKQHAVLAAISQLGVAYRYAASEPGAAFDCSGLTRWAFDQAGSTIPRISGDQIDAAESTESDAAEPGDLVYWPGHIGIFLGADTYVHSPNSGNVVEVARLPDRELRFGAVVDDDPDADAAGGRTALDTATSVLDSLVDRTAPVTK